MHNDEENAERVVEALMPDIDKFHQLCKGGLEAIGLLFSEIAEERLAAPVVCQILKLDEENVKASFMAGTPPTVTLEELVEALKNAVDPEDTVDNYTPVFQRRIQKFENAKQIMDALMPSLSDFHTKVDGKVESIAAFFEDLVPAAQKGKKMPPGVVNVILRIQPTASKCPLEAFLSCLERQLDVTDTVEVVSKVTAQGGAQALQRQVQPHVVFLELSMAGHINPTVPLVAAFVRRGCRVTYFASAETADPVSKHTALGQSIIAAGADLTLYRAAPALKDHPLLLKGTALDTVTWSWLPDLLADLRSLRPPPSVILYDPVVATFAAAAAIVNVPRIAVEPNTGPGGRWVGFEEEDVEEARRTLAGPRAWLLQEHQLDLFDLGLPTRSWYAPKLNLVLGIEMLYSGLGACPAAMRALYSDAAFRCVGAMDQAASDFRPRPPDFPLDEIKAARERGLRVVYLSLGSMLTGAWLLETFASRATKGLQGNIDEGDSAVDGATLREMRGADFARFVFGHAIAALGGRADLLVLVSCGYRGPEEVLSAAGFEDRSALPDNFRFFGFVPQLAVLPLCACHITHGATASVMESILFRVPMVAVPVHGDQTLNADAIAQAGLGFSFRFPLKTLNTEALRDAVLAAVGLDEETSGKQKQLVAAVDAAAREMERNGGPDKAAEIVLEAVSEGTA